MEERKLVDIEEVKDVLGDTINSEGDYRHALRLLNGLSSVTEQDIVKPVLDKIRAEIEEQVLESLSDGGDDWFTAEKVNECLDIIDKYRTEGEG